MKEKKRKKQEKSGRVRRLVIANLIATLVLITVSVAVLWALGLLGSIFAFFF